MNQPCRPAKLIFLDSDIEVATSSLQDQWTLRLAAGLKSTAANSGSLRLLPWEALLWAPGELHTVNSSARVPEHLLDDYANVRDAVAKKLNGKELTIIEMQRAMANDLKALCGLDASFSLELAYLNGRVERLLEDKTHTKILQALPNEDAATMTWQVAINDIKQIWKGPLCRAGGTSLSGDAEGVLSMVSRLSEGEGPDPDKVQHFSAFYRGVLHRLSFFCKWADGAKGSCNVFGRAALLKSIEDMKDDLAKQEAVELSKTKMLRQFEWLLSKAHVFATLQHAKQQRRLAHGATEGGRSTLRTESRRRRSGYADGFGLCFWIACSPAIKPIGGGSIGD